MVNVLHDILIPACLIVGPVLGYIPQYIEIAKTSNPRAFSPLVILILLVSNIIRIFFWMMKRFELALLWQSVVMIASQLIMLELMVRLRSQQVEFSAESYSVFGRDLGRFWNWNSLEPYLSWLAGFFLLFGTITIINLYILQSMILTESIGTLALLIEATLAMPQLMQNYRCKSTRGLRVELVGAWALGDAAKTVLFVARRSPFQFLACGVIQLVVDFGIFYQMRIYGNNPYPDFQGSDDDNVLASSILLERGPDGEKSPKLPPKSLTKSMDAFDAGETPKRSNSMRTRSPTAFYQTM